MLIVGDSDIARPEHVVEMFRLLRGAVPGDITTPSRSQLAVLQSTTHFTLASRVDVNDERVSEGSVRNR